MVDRKIINWKNFQTTWPNPGIDKAEISQISLSNEIDVKKNVHGYEKYEFFEVYKIDW